MQRPIVVGVDGSPASVHAVRWAAMQAERLLVEVAVVSVVPESTAGRKPQLRREEYAKSRELAAALQAVVDETVPPGDRRRQRVSQEVVHGLLVDTLTARSQGAELLVLGRAPGTDPVRSTATGRCLREALCPVAVVPDLLVAEPFDDSARTGPARLAARGDQPVREVMSPAVLGVSASTGVDTALQLMIGAGIHHLPVMERGRCIGLVYETDLLWRMPGWPRRGRMPSVTDVARMPAPTVAADQPVSQAAAELSHSVGDAVVVADEDQIVGIVTGTDLLASPAGDGETEATLVVGVDGSALSQYALTWGVSYASRTHCGVLAASICSLTPPLPFASVPAPREELDALAAAHTDVLEAAVAHAEPARYDVDLRTSVVYGKPGPALCALAANAAGLIIGSHGASAAPAPVLGSASAYCLRHAQGPVIVIPPAATERPQSYG
ncbi:universal stress protein [Actinopolymorpha sp. B11F2]|uniref:universal stress protein n=1 Tax=Actinopolymorpha sp. B11F2 TaxID=3160862 RepID=UPI0032E44D2E